MQYISTCKNVFYTRWYHFYSHVCNGFTCKNVLHTHWYVVYAHGCIVRAWNLFWASVAKPVFDSWLFYCPVHLLICLLSHGCNKFLHARLFFTLADMITPIFTVITKVWPRANRAVVTNNNSTVIIKVVIIEAVLIEGFLYCTHCLKKWEWVPMGPSFHDFVIIYPRKFFLKLKCTIGF